MSKWTWLSFGMVGLFALWYWKSSRDAEFWDEEAKRIGKFLKQAEEAGLHTPTPKITDGESGISHYIVG